MIEFAVGYRWRCERLEPQNPGEPKHASESDALAVVQRLREAGHVAYFAGGCVRDMLLGLTPKDFDVATDAPPGRVRELFKNTQAVGAAFGVILVRLGKSVIEVATFRTDLKYVDGRRPEGVVFTTAEEDAKRRDFTINGMFFDPVEKEVIDYVGGQQDLKYKWLRTIGNPDERFEEDHLRLLRGIRFAARFGLEIKGKTAGAIASHREQLIRISPERIGEELRMMLTAPTRLAAWHELTRFGFLPVLFRYLPKTTATANPEWPLLLSGALAGDDVVPFGYALAVLALSHRVDGLETPAPLFEPMEIRRTVQACRKAMKISNDEADLLEASTNLAPVLSPEPPRVAVLKRFLAKPNSVWPQRLLRALPKVFPSYEDRVTWLDAQIATIPRDSIAPSPFVTGDDLTAAGLSPGPAFKKVLDAVYDAQLEGRVSTKAAALELAISIVSN